MTDTRQPNSATPKRPRDGFMFIMLVLLFIAVGLIVSLLLNPYEDGELILTKRGCHVLAYHGATVEDLGDEGLCRVRAHYALPSNTSRFGTIRIETPKGRIDISLPASEVVSKPGRPY